MPTVRIAVASTPLTATLEEAVPAAVAAVEEAGRQGAAIVCLPETGLPGHRVQARPVPDVTRGGARGRARRGRRGGPRGRGRHDRRRRAADAGGPRDRRGRDRRRRGAARRAGQDADRPERGAALRRGQRPPRVHGRGRDLRDRDLPRGVPLPRDRPLARARRGAGRLRAPLRDHRRRVAPGHLVRRIEPVQREGAHVPRAGEHRLRRRAPTSPRPTRARSPALSAPTARSSRACPTAPWESPAPTWISTAPTRCSRGGGRRSAICSRRGHSRREHRARPARVRRGCTPPRASRWTTCAAASGPAWRCARPASTPTRKRLRSLRARSCRAATRRPTSRRGRRPAATTGSSCRWPPTPPREARPRPRSPPRSSGSRPARSRRSRWPGPGRARTCARSSTSPPRTRS